GDSQALERGVPRKRESTRYGFSTAFSHESGGYEWSAIRKKNIPNTIEKENLRLELLAEQQDDRML
ncbi:MAG: hypothetical protein ACKPKO_21740, partial [Candidatus Fonsibacter sp.]